MPFEEFHDEERRTALFGSGAAEVVDGDDVRAAEVAGGPGLGGEPFGAGGRRVGTRQQFHRHRAADPFVEGSPDLAHPAGAQD
ncbi:hypothetical protein OG715_23915 [Kitasatospora purpeofusca]|nr:hypothetical protein [Kitasatospora purpeofusca]MCX4754324.1 hypothetical protein [Kitasatospora purpeofusca]WSR33752.1 hypothetical protein OG715_23915 [Kitasatospora purpeofusca]